MKVDEIVKTLKKAADQYYNEGDSFLTDAEFNQLEDQLRELDPTNNYFLGVGSDVRGGKVALPYPMGSLDLVRLDSVDDWLDQIGNAFISHKLDGTSVLLVYDGNGELQIAYSRGNGTEGADITRHIRKITNVPKKIKSKNLVVRGEIILPVDIELKTRNMVSKLSGRKYKNARNFVAGQINSKESYTPFYDNVRVVVYAVVNSDEDFVYRHEEMSFLQNLGFETVRFDVIQNGQGQMEKIYERAKQRSLYEIDGLVIEPNLLKSREMFKPKENSYNPGYARKFKILGGDNEAVATVKDVVWQASRYGYLKPRVNIEPVDMLGVTIQYCTGHNAKFIRDNQIGPGAKIRITRSGDVIPYILECIVPSENTKLPDGIWNENEVELIDPDHDDNNPERIKFFFDKIECDGFKGKSVERFLSARYDTIQDIVTADVSVFRKLIGENSGVTAFENLEKALTNISEARFAAASGCFERGIGERILTRLLRDGKLVLLNKDEMMQIDGFSDKTIEKIYNSFYKYTEFKKSLQNYVTFKKEEMVNTMSNNEYVVFTGVRDKEFASMLESKGYQVGDSMSKVTVLIAKDPNGSSSKLKKAREKGVRILGLQEAKAQL